MILELITFLIFLSSVLGIVFLLSKKIPTLRSLPDQGHYGFVVPKIYLSWKEKIFDAYVYFFKKQMLLHTILSRSRILILRLEKQLDILLSGIRRNTQEVNKKTRKRK